MNAPRRYLVKEMFGPTLQGEGAHAGRPCVFLRFAACNLECSFCDTDFAVEGAVQGQAVFGSLSVFGSELASPPISPA